ncbi:MAG TPA: hypothetical protein VGI30_02885 [Caulobacteraceae bacterium]
MWLVIPGAIVAFSLAQAGWAETLPPPHATAVTVIGRRPLDLSLTGSWRGRAYPRASAIETQIAPRTAVDHRLGSDALVGQAGYLCGIGGIGPDDDAPRGGPASAFEHFGTFLGAKVGYAFR